MAALIMAAAMAAAPASAAERYFQLAIGAAPFERVLRDALSGEFELWMSGSAANPEAPAVLDRKGGLRFDPASSTLSLRRPAPAELERALRILEDSHWNPGAATALGPDGTVEAYVVPNAPGGTYRLPADGEERSYRLEVESAEAIGGGGAGGGGGGGAGGAGGSGGI